MKKFIDELAKKTKFHKVIEEYISSCLENSKSTIKTVDGVEMNCEVEKIHALQHAYYFDFLTPEGVEICFSIAGGIDYNGVIDYDFDGRNAIDIPNTVRVLDDIEIDLDRVASHLGKSKEDISSNQLVLINKIFDYHKEDILELYKKQNYDDYFTGGGTIKTDNFYKNSFNKYHKLGLYWKCIYKHIEADRNIL